MIKMLLLEIMSAEEKRKQYEEYQEEQRRKEREKKEELNAKATENAIRLFPYVKEQIENEMNFTHKTIVFTTANGFDKNTPKAEIKKTVEIIGEILNFAGYRTSNLNIWDTIYKEEICRFVVSW
jgi:carbonic anhydrase